MAIYHMSAQMMSRSSGRSAVAAAAYRSGGKLQDHRTGGIRDYSRKEVAESVILTPEGAPEWARDRQSLWNTVEFAEKRRDAQLCREINLALPRELTDNQQRELLLAYAGEQFVSRGMVADVAIHRNDPGNPHAHIMLTTRYIGPEGFGQKNRDWNQKALLVSWREEWADAVNHALEHAGFEQRIDHRSLKEQGIEDRLPMVHEGPNVREMERRGIPTERGEINRLVHEYNAVVVDLEEYRLAKEQQELLAAARITPEEHETLQQAATILGQTAALPVLPNAYEALERREEGFKQQEQRLKEEFRTFEKAEMHYDAIGRCEQQMQSLGSLLRSENRRIRSRLQETIADCKKELSALGFADRAAFESRKAKFERYMDQELTGLEHARRANAAAWKVLTRTETTLQQIEQRTVAALYPQWAAAPYLSYPDALILKEVNERLGGTTAPDEIREAYAQRSAKLTQLKVAVRDIERDQERLKGAAEWVKKYEDAEKEVQRLDQFGNRIYRKLSRGMEAEFGRRLDEMAEAEARMAHFRVDSRADFNRQQEQLSQSLTRKPDLKNRIAELQPGVSLLSRALDGVDRASRALELEQQQRQRGEVRQRSRNREHER